MKGRLKMIHSYKLGGLNIVLDICSGSVHVVDEVAYDIIGLYEKEDKDNIIALMLEKYADIVVNCDGAAFGKYQVEALMKIQEYLLK